MPLNKENKIEPRCNKQMVSIWFKPEHFNEYAYNFSKITVYLIH